MKTVFIFLTLLMMEAVGFAQPTRVAILDFENISGIAKYDGLGKAMSSMLISDIEANVSPKRLQLVERAQIQKVLKEQNFQASGSVNKSTAVQAGKILGVNYLLVGDIYILNDQLIINARLTNTETGDIVFSKKQEGKSTDWLTLKTNIGKDLATSLSQPFTQATIADKEIKVETITTFGNAIAAKDIGDLERANSIAEILHELYPDFAYLNDLKLEIEKIKIEMKLMNEKIDDALDNPEEIAMDLIDQNKDLDKALRYLCDFCDRQDFYTEYGDTKKLFCFWQKARILYRKGDLKGALAQYDSCLLVDNNFLLAHYNKMSLMMGGNYTNLSKNVAVLKIEDDYQDEILQHFDFITKYSHSNQNTFNKDVYRATQFNDEGKCNDNLNSKDCVFYDYAIEMPLKNGGTVFDDLMRDISVYSLQEHLNAPTNLVTSYLMDRGELLLSKTILENAIDQEILYLSSLEQKSSWSGTDRNFDLLKKSGPVFLNNDLRNYAIFFDYHSDAICYHGNPNLPTIYDHFSNLAILYIQTDRQIEGLKMLENLCVITKRLADGQPNFQKEYFKFLLNYVAISELAGCKSFILKEECKDLFGTIKKNFATHFTDDLDFDLHYSLKLEELKQKLKPEDLKNNKVFKDRLSYLDFAIYPSVQEIRKYYNEKLIGNVLIAHVVFDGIITDTEFSDEYYLNFTISDRSNLAFKENFHINKHEFEHACSILTDNNIDDNRITIIITIDENGDSYINHIEPGWVKYDSLEWSMKKFYQIDDYGKLNPIDRLVEVNECLSNLSSVENYNDRLLDCFSTFEMQEVFDIYMNNSVGLNNYSWAICNSKKADLNSLRWSLKMAERATYIMFDTDHNILDTYAYCLLKNGYKEKSREILNKAIEVAFSAEDLDSVKKYQEKLKSY